MRNMQKLKLEGFQPGFPDLVVFLPGLLLCIELKRVKGGRIAKNQERWKETLNHYPYIESRVCYGADDAIKLIKGLK